MVAYLIKLSNQFICIRLNYTVTLPSNSKSLLHMFCRALIGCLLTGEFELDLCVRIVEHDCISVFKCAWSDITQHE